MRSKSFWILVTILLGLNVKLAAVAQSPAADSRFVGAAKCASCHSEIASVQMKSEHALTLRKVKTIPELLQALPLHFSDRANGVEYRLELSAKDESSLDLWSSKDRSTERLQLIWAFGAGRKEITFVGRTTAGEYGQGRVSWYQKE
jgi:hypothetical protein